MEEPEVAEVFTLPGGHLVPLKHITTIGEVRRGSQGHWGFTMHVEWGSPLIGTADYIANYPTQFEAMAVREALCAAVMRERQDELARRARLEW